MSQVRSFECTKYDIKEGQNEIMKDSHLKRIKRSESGNPMEDEWVETSTLGEKLPDQIIEEVPMRSIILERNTKESFDRFSKQVPEIKNEIKDTRKFLEELNEHVLEKRSEIKNFQERNQRFDEEIAKLKYEITQPKFNLSKSGVNESKVTKLQNQLDTLQIEHKKIKTKIEHFSNQLVRAQYDLSLKTEQMQDIEHELKRLENVEMAKQKNTDEGQALELIKKELNEIKNNKDSEKIFNGINDVVEQLKTKNELTVKEISTVKNEIKQLRQKYEEIIKQI